MNIKSLLLFFIFVGILSSCKSTSYQGFIGQNITTEVSLSKANFKVLGSFSGTATAKKTAINIKNKSGVISAAKMNLLENAKAQGVELTGSRTLINVTTDLIDNSNRVTCTMSAEIIEFLDK